MDYINGGARDIGRRKEVRFLSYLQGIPFVYASVRARALCTRTVSLSRVHLKADELG